MIKKAIKYLKNLYVPYLGDDQLRILNNEKNILDKNIENIGSYIETISNFNAKRDFFLEPDDKFYNKSLHLQASSIQDKIGLSSICCPIKFSGGGMFDLSSGKFIKKTRPKPVFDVESKTLRWAKDDTQKLEIEICYEFKDSPICVCGILAHEFTHLYFHMNGLSKLFSDKRMEEQCCDLTIFLLGLGKLTMNSFAGSVSKQDYTGTRIMALGYYLPWYELCYVYEKINMLLDIPEEISRRNLNENAIDKLRILRRYPDLFKV